ncbi:tetratricopeptide repeat-containing sensor histidine kinase [Flavobacterium granuli]|uniref:histidine kinase n=1 Tax=Flavobacterium granuli TaxID=280093 RepID=A0A1M5R3Z4_9FLAO|nr:sensor histidine kinase [Flavobacterium granuli]PRZ21591.1 histidine kinase [Flavobacterium granuli]SHH20740.1 Histidine kinase [Flavobacterium granuli]
MKTKYSIVLLVNLFLLITACQKKKDDIEYKNGVTHLLNNLNSSVLQDTSKIKTLDTLFLYLQRHENDSINRNLFFKVANKYYDLNQYDNYLFVTKKVLELAIKKKDTVHIAKSLYYLGDYFEEKTVLDSAFYYYAKSEKLYKSIKDTSNTGKTALYKAGILYDAGNFTESEIELVAALRLLNKTNNTRLIYESYNLMALSLKEINNHKKSLEYFELALKQLDKLESEGYIKERIIKSRASINNNMGRVYDKMENQKEAIRLYKKGLQTNRLKQDHPKLYAMLLNNLAYAQMKSGNSNGIREKFFESLRIRDSLDIKPGIVTSKIAIGEYFIHQKDTTKALTYFKEGFVLSKKINSSYDVIQSLKLLTENDIKNKTHYTKLYIKVTDSFQNAERATRNKFARIAYETEQIEEKNDLLSKRNSTIIIGSGIVILFLTGFFIIYRLKSRNKELLFIQEQQETNEKIYQLMLKQQSETEQARKEERNRIAMELHDGIVNSIFTTRFNLIQLDPNAADKKEQLVKELEKAENEIRRVSHDLTENLLFEDKSLPEIITTLVESQQNQCNTRFDVSIDKYIDWSKIASANKIHIYRIIQEALQNVNKYSKAERCYIMLLKTADKISIRIWDNGIGFNPEKVKQGIGLKNIKSRTEALNGELKISSNSEKGTTIEIIF